MSFELPTIKWHDATGRVKAEVKPLVSDVETRIACVRRLLDNRRNLGNDVVAANKSFEAGKLPQRIISNFCCVNLTFIGNRIHKYPFPLFLRQFCMFFLLRNCDFIFLK